MAKSHIIHTLPLFYMQGVKDKNFSLDTRWYLFISQEIFVAISNQKVLSVLSCLPCKQGSHTYKTIQLIHWVWRTFQESSMKDAHCPKVG